MQENKMHGKEGRLLSAQSKKNRSRERERKGNEGFSCWTWDGKLMRDGGGESREAERGGAGLIEAIEVCKAVHMQVLRLSLEWAFYSKNSPDHHACEKRLKKKKGQSGKRTVHDLDFFSLIPQPL